LFAYNYKEKPLSEFMKPIRFPSALTLLLIITAVVALLTRLLPSGEFDKLIYDSEKNVFRLTGSDSKILPATQETLNELGVKIPLEKFTGQTLWKPVGIPGTYHRTNTKEQHFTAVIQAPLKGIVQAIDIILFVLILGGAIGVVHGTGAFDSGMVSLSHLLKGREHLLIVVITGLIAAGGTTFGMAEETIAFYPILIPVFLAAGYDAIVAVTCIYIGSSIGTMAGTVNPFATIIASDAAGINWLSGINGRIMFLFISLAVCLWYILRYARKVKKNPEDSLVFKQRQEIEKVFMRSEASLTPVLNLRQKLILLIFSACFIVMIYGVSGMGWWFMEMTTVFFVGSILIGLISGENERKLADSFVKGASDLLSVALVIGVARGITILMEEGQISDTLLYYSSLLVEGMPKVFFINVLYFVYMGLSLFISSSSGMAVLTMPIFSPLADVVGIDRELVVNAYQYGQGLFAFINPTGLILASLTVVNIGFNKWLRFIMPLFVILLIMGMIALSSGIYL
jgi:uncharacterized ion transporter superfamily protein YfcC